MEVIRGSFSALYGSNALAGVINIFTKKPQSKKEISTSVGSYGFFDARVCTRFKSGNFHVGFSGGYFESDGYFKTPNEDRNVYSMKSWLREKRASIKAYWESPQYGKFSVYFLHADGINELRTNYRGNAVGEYRGECKRYGNDLMGYRKAWNRI